MKRLHRLGLFSPLNDPRLSAGKNEITGLWSSDAGKIECIHRRKISNVRQMTPGSSLAKFCGPRFRLEALMGPHLISGI